MLWNLKSQPFTKLNKWLSYH